MKKNNKTLRLETLNAVEPTNHEEIFYIRKNSLVDYGLYKLTLDGEKIVSREEIRKSDIPAMIMALYVKAFRDQRTFK